MVTDPDRDRYVVNRIMAFYRRQPTGSRRLLRRAVALREPARARARQRVASRRPRRRTAVAPRYLDAVRGMLQDRTGAFGPLAGLHHRWDAMPAGAARPDEEAVRAAAEKLRDYVIASGRSLPGRSTFRAPAAAGRLADAGDARQPPGGRAPPAPQPVGADLGRQRPIPRRRATTRLSSSLPRAQHGQRRRGAERFCDVFPAPFSSRTDVDLAGPNQTGRLLSAGFHSAMGYFRDDRPLYDLILDESGRREIDELWRELDFVSNAPARQLAGFVWFERTDSDFMLSKEFNHLRAEDQDLRQRGEVRRAAAAV